MYILIKDLLSEQQFLKYDVILHFPLRNLILDFENLTSEEERYAKHHSTHLDFVIFNKLGKNPVLAIEVDGYEYHRKESRQAERDAMKNDILEKYRIPLIRFSTTGSEEKVKLIRILKKNSIITVLSSPFYFEIFFSKKYKVIKSLLTNLVKA